MYVYASYVRRMNFVAFLREVLIFIWQPWPQCHCHCQNQNNWANRCRSLFPVICLQNIFCLWNCRCGPVPYSCIVGRRTLVGRLSWRKAVIMILAVVAIAAACIAVWLSHGFLYTVAASILFAALYAAVFHTRWCYVAVKTTPRDLR